MLANESKSAHDFYETVFQLADRVGTAPIWDLLVNVGIDLADCARERAVDGADWNELADKLDTACRARRPDRVWRELRETIRVYDAYRVSGADHDPSIGAAVLSKRANEVEAPVVLGLRNLSCNTCAKREFLFFVTDPDDVLARCASCGTRATARIGSEFAADVFGVNDLLDRRRHASRTLASTRETIRDLEGGGDYDENGITLVPLYRLEAQHMTRIRRTTRELVDIIAGSDEPRPRV